MNFLNTAVLSSLGGVALGRGLLAQDQAQWNEVDAWAEEIAANDRHLLLNGQPLPEMDEPQRPYPPTLYGKATWLLIPLFIWFVPAALGGLIGAAVMTTPEAPAGWLAGFPLGFVLASIPSLLAAVVVGSLVNAYRVRRNQQAKLHQEILAAHHGVWAMREDARHQFDTGVKPVAYLEAIGLDPQRL